MREIKIYRNVAKLKEIDMFYLDTKTEGPVILCLHGRWGRAETWADFIERYGGRYRIIAPDQRGHGLTGRPLSSYTPKEMAEDAIELLDFLEIDSAVVVGHSMGGGVAGYLAAVYPQRIKAAAILDRSAAGPSGPQALPEDISGLKNDLTKDWPLPFSTLNEAMQFIKSGATSDLEYQYFMNSLTETVEGYHMMFSSQAMAIGIANYTGWFHLLPKIRCPVLLVRASTHEAVPDEDFEKMQSLLRNCLAYDIPHPDHNVHLSNKEEFYGYFDYFLSWADGIG